MGVSNWVVVGVVLLLIGEILMMSSYERCIL